jgi:hypothetical protein
MSIRFWLVSLLKLSMAVLLGVLPCGCLLIYISLINSYWNYYDMGISENANMWGVLFLHIPILFAILYGSLMLCWTTMHGLQRPIWQTFVLMTLIYVLVIFTAFFMEVVQTADERTSSGQGLDMFFQAYFEQWSIFLRKKF